MEVETGNWVNEFGFVDMQSYSCPHCGAKFELDDEVAEDSGDPVRIYDGIESTGGETPS